MDRKNRQEKKVKSTWLFSLSNHMMRALLWNLFCKERIINENNKLFEFVNLYIK